MEIAKGQEVKLKINYTYKGINRLLYYSLDSKI